MLGKFFNIDNKWFFSAMPYKLKYLTIFIKGDALVLTPLIIAILLTYFISLKFMLLMVGFYLIVRYLGEMIFWLLKQFGDRKYRPPDAGFKNLDNHAIYIFYQTLAIAWMMVGVGIVLYVLLYF